MNNILTNNEKAKLFDDYVRQADTLNRKINRIKSEYFSDIPPVEQAKINDFKNQITELEEKLRSLYY